MKIKKYLLYLLCIWEVLHFLFFLGLLRQYTAGVTDLHSIILIVLLAAANIPLLVSLFLLALYGDSYSVMLYPLRVWKALHLLIEGTTLVLQSALFPLIAYLVGRLFGRGADISQILYLPAPVKGVLFTAFLLDLLWFLYLLSYKGGANAHYSNSQR